VAASGIAALDPVVGQLQQELSQNNVAPGQEVDYFQKKGVPLSPQLAYLIQMNQRIRQGAQMSQAQAPQTTVARDLEQMLTQQGVGALPAGDVAAPQAFARGGIVSFQEGGLTEDADLIRRVAQEQEEFNRRLLALPGDAAGYVNEGIWNIAKAPWEAAGATDRFLRGLRNPLSNPLPGQPGYNEWIREKNPEQAALIEFGRKYGPVEGRKRYLEATRAQGITAPDPYRPPSTTQTFPMSPVGLPSFARNPSVSGGIPELLRTPGIAPPEVTGAPQSEAPPIDLAQIMAGAGSYGRSSSGTAVSAPKLQERAVAEAARALAEARAGQRNPDQIYDERMGRDAKTGRADAEAAARRRLEERGAALPKDRKEAMKWELAKAFFGNVGRPKISAVGNIGRVAGSFTEGAAPIAEKFRAQEEAQKDALVALQQAEAARREGNYDVSDRLALEDQKRVDGFQSDNINALRSADQTAGSMAESVMRSNAQLRATEMGRGGLEDLDAMNAQATRLMMNPATREQGERLAAQVEQGYLRRAAASVMRTQSAEEMAARKEAQKVIDRYALLIQTGKPLPPSIAAEVRQAQAILNGGGSAGADDSRYARFDKLTGFKQ
jgi:hypothetical protein